MLWCLNPALSDAPNYFVLLFMRITIYMLCGALKVSATA